MEASTGEAQISLWLNFGLVWALEWVTPGLATIQFMHVSENHRV